MWRTCLSSAAANFKHGGFKLFIGSADFLTAGTPTPFLPKTGPPLKQLPIYVDTYVRREPTAISC